MSLELVGVARVVWVPAVVGVTAATRLVAVADNGSESREGVNDQTQAKVIRGGL